MKSLHGGNVFWFKLCGMGTHYIYIYFAAPPVRIKYFIETESFCTVFRTITYHRNVLYLNPLIVSMIMITNEKVIIHTPHTLTVNLFSIYMFTQSG